MVRGGESEEGMRVRTLAWGLAAVLALAGCASPPSPPTPPAFRPTPPATLSPVIDSWSVGPEAPCADSQFIPSVTCGEMVAVGRAGLDERDPGHAPVASVEFHAEGMVLDARGVVVPVIRSGPCCAVLVFRLTDGSERAIGVGAPGTGPLRAIPRGPSGS